MIVLVETVDKCFICASGYVEVIEIRISYYAYEED